MLKFVKKIMQTTKNILLDNDREPSDEELTLLMNEVTKEVKKKEEKANIDFSEKIKLQVLEAKERFKLKHG
jgi:hypothetical protein